MITFFLNRRCLFKHQISKKEISLTFLIITSILLNRQILKTAHGYNTLVTSTLFALELLEPLSTMLLLANTDSSSFLRKTFHVYVVYILSNLDDIFYMIRRGLITIGIQEETPLLILSYFSNITIKPFPSEKTLLHLWALCLLSGVICSIYFLSFLFCLFLSIFLFSFSFSHIVSVCMYVVMK